MTILKIARMGHPVLREVANPVEAFGTDELAQLLDDMVETMDDAGGTGLAATQVHVPLRVVVYFVSEGRGGMEEGIPLTALINPVITPLDESIGYGWEGCLSVPGLTGLVPRYEHVKLEAQDFEGNPISFEAHGFHARVLQHECDHLDGILYPQRMDDLSLLMYSEEMRHGLPEAAREKLGLPPEE